MKKILLLCAGLCVGIAVYGQTTVGEDLAIQRRLMGLKMSGLIPMRFANAVDGKPIAGAQIAIEGIGDFVTNNEGIITFPERDDGYFSLIFSKQGFITTAIDFEIKLNNVFGNRFSISPELPRGFRIVLDWGEHPADLDLHLEKAGGYHISYWNMHSADDGTAFLDRDDRHSFGPETITVERIESTGVYDIYIIDYTNRNLSNSYALSQSGAVVRVYGDNRLLRTFRVPENRPGMRWDVCRIVNGVVN
ncbi:hypothetical protein FACS1894164_16330 [Spirochaetia bacterium]|nr:hypothetical protein FACS1894164_16330 [Spirochaetia bacterium]